MMEGDITKGDPRDDDVRDLLAQHLAFTTSVSPPEDMHALDVDGLLDPTVTFFCFRIDGRLVGVGALKRLDAGHGEVKSMHTARWARGQGVAHRMVVHIMETARGQGFDRLSLETGSQKEFEPAQRLYLSMGFEMTDPFGDYLPSPNSVFMTRLL
jgi:putative acetyltransferase